MTLELHIIGQGLDTLRMVRPGETELVLGRDADCGVHLPDPERTVSRRHLAVWNVAGELHFRVLSSVNGVDMPFGYVPPGGTGVLEPRQLMKIGEYTMDVRLSAAAADHDPWAVFAEAGEASDATLPRGALVAGQREEVAAPLLSAEEDPFGDWGFESTFSPDADGSGLPAVAQGPGTSELASFYKGLGLDIGKISRLSPAELEAAGRAVRAGLVGLFDLYASRSGVPPREDGAPLVPVQDNNPLKNQWTEQTKLQYLFGGRSESIGFVSQHRALTEVVSELLAHDAAVTAATRDVLESTLQEFAPDALKDRLLGAGTKLFEGSRAWEAYLRFYAGKSEDVAAWVEQLLDKYFNEAYLRESQRIKRETGQ